MIDTFCICELCREKVDPADPHIGRAIQLIVVGGLGPTNHRLPGLTVFFHRDHYPSNSADYAVQT